MSVLALLGNMSVLAGPSSCYAPLRCSAQSFTEAGQEKAIGKEPKDTMTLESIATISYSFAGVVGLLYISRQVAIARDQAKGQFLLSLDDRLEKSMEVTSRLFNDQNFTPVGKEWGRCLAIDEHL